MSIEGLLGTVSRSIWRYDQDYSDRLHTTVTSNLLVAMAGVTGWKTWSGSSPIECAIPAMFSESVASVSNPQ